MTTTHSSVIGGLKKGPCGRSPGPCSHCRYSSARARQQPTPELFPMCQRSARTQSACEPTLRISEACVFTCNPVTYCSVRAVDERSPWRIEGKRICFVLGALAYLLPMPQKTVVASKPRKAKCDVGAKACERSAVLWGDPVKGPLSFPYIGWRRQHWQFDRMAFVTLRNGCEQFTIHYARSAASKNSREV